VGEASSTTAAGVDRDQPEELVAPLVVEEGERPAVRRPTNLVDRPGIRKQAPIERHFAAVGPEEPRPAAFDPVAGLEIVERDELGLKLIAGATFYDVHRMRLGRLDIPGHEQVAGR
jgi:hypothetical protein